MKLPLSLIAAVCITHTVLPVPAHAADVEAGLTLVAELAQVNGQALACQDMAAAARAKKLMLAHAPKTQRFGSAFEEGTNASYLAQARGTAPCPDAVALAARMDALAKRLAEALPVTPSGMQ